MGSKNQFPSIANWQSTSPTIGFLPQQVNQSSSLPLSGNIHGVMSGTNTIYSQILEISRVDNQGLEVTWTGTPTGLFQVMVSNSGINFYALTFNPALSQPAGSPGGYAVDLNQLPFKYIMLQYTNTSGSGTISVYIQTKDLN